MIQGKLTRRGFLAAAGATAAAPLVARAEGGAVVARPRLSDGLTALLADTHFSAHDPDFAYIERTFRDEVADILRHDPLPRRVVVFGDLAFFYGDRDDYLKARECFKPLLDLGVEVTFGLGNHDNRANFFEVFPEAAAKTPVKGLCIAEAHPAGVDVLMLDTIFGGADPVKKTLTDAGLTDAEYAWLAETLPKRTRPVLVCGHHPIEDVTEGRGKGLLDVLLKSPAVVGYAHGHSHKWRTHVFENWNSTTPFGREFFREVSLPCVASYGHIGYAWMRSDAAGCRIDAVVKDAYFFPRPKDGLRLQLWREMTREANGQTCAFPAPRGRR